jgi:hypothetical protein
MSAAAAPAISSSQFFARRSVELLPDTFVGSSGATFLRVVFRPVHNDSRPKKSTGSKRKGTEGTGTT